MERKRLLARVTDDGYLLGCTDDFAKGWSERYWTDYYEETDTEIDTIAIEVPSSIVLDLLNHGTSDQTYSDGYEAWQDILRKGRVFE